MSPEEHKRKQLGRGLSALLGDSAGEGTTPVPLVARGGARPIAVSQIRPSRFQPRRHFPTEEIDELAASIRSQGVLQPILVRRDPQTPGNFELIAGERRWRAAQAAQLHEIPALVRELSDQEALEAALVENLQRQDLTPLEEAEAYRRLMDDFGHTQEDIAAALGKSRPAIANAVRLLELPEEVKALIDSGELSAGHARVLVTAADPLALARRIVADKLTVRQAEALAQGLRAKPPRRNGARDDSGRDADTLALERRLSAELGLSVSIEHKRGAKGGSLVIRYQTLDQLDDLLARLSRRA
jgi:ParB family chromosome partitioning protein